ncbi:hypothetical protein [Aestuariimicrobium sp. T2.26MG-19.2B]|uniref:hypothetical protein n=1 Tax=Aestuariimicrobium sp. T2.26MG-19.2B TaxID=3040679 RepID=UPI0024773617|nr:hypothetical protein [Aestuariimicrobium sp. T2.26MG-19.2B]CAI9401776.1 hypothetical protein AESSP_00661 [Aestuariimicrobium sp. T2.26MG-19.2B]
MTATLPFGLVPADLPWVSPQEGERLDLTVGRRGPLTGGGNTAVISVVPLDGQRRSVFVKRTADRLRREANRYRALAGRVPLPKLLTVVERDEAEVMVLEHLPRTGPDAASMTPGSSAEVDSVLELSASLARVTDVDQSVFPHQPGMDQTVFEGIVARTLGALTEEGFAVDPAAWLLAYRTAGTALAGFPRALSHGEFALQHIGRTSQGELVMVDLETCFPRARFTDPATLLREVSGLVGEAERSLFERWCAAAEMGGEADDHWREFLTTRIVVAVETLPWLVSEPTLASRLPGVVEQVSHDLSGLR